MNKVKLNEMVGGALNEKFQNSFERVLENLQDVNTPFADKREIVIKMTFVQNEARDDVGVDIKVTEKLAPQGTLKTRFFIDTDSKSDDFIVEEHENQLRGQMAIV